MANSIETERTPNDKANGSLDELKQEVTELKGELEFGRARKLLVRAAAANPEDVWIKQQLALCTYKDEELHPIHRLERALALLEELHLRDPEKVEAETLRLGGAIHKRMWEQSGQLEPLYEALACYRTAYQRNPEEDQGYGGVNAAYILDVLASRARVIAKRSGTSPVEATALEEQVRELRTDMLKRVVPLTDTNPQLNEEYWFVVTGAEIHFGLGSYDEAAQWLSQAKNLAAKEWERQTTFRQLVSLARLQGIELPRQETPPLSWHGAWRALSCMLDKNVDRALSCSRGKIGLALSGGGFRASLYHLGVLARLAEIDALRGVAVLSTVSGGSIVGAHYYLEVQKRLQTKPDSQITRGDYIEIVKQVQQDFLRGVQRNLRTRALASFFHNLKMIFATDYSRSHRIGELYEQELYAWVGESHTEERPSGEQPPEVPPRCMSDLLIQPKGETDFKPKFSNWRRGAKVPILLLNATSLNSGHNWHFTASWMGEPPGLLGSEVDKNRRYRRLYYRQAPTQELQKFRLGYAVAASACVPGLFEPLAMSGLYPEHVVRLVDGGVHDNQGVAGLLDEGCNIVLCSDASGQMADIQTPADSVLGVPLRANDILMDRVREAEYQDLRARVDSGALAGLFFIHLKKDLPALPIDWVNTDDPTDLPMSYWNPTPYGVNEDLQHHLAAIRTDLDSFTEVESYSLMLSGYLTAEDECHRLQLQHEKNGELGTWGGFDINAPRGDWPFLKLASLIGQPSDSDDPGRQDLGRQLKAASSLFFKVWRLDPALQGVSWIALVLAGFLVAGLTILCWNTSIELPALRVGTVMIGLGLIALGLINPVFAWLSPGQASRGIFRKAGLALFGYVATQIHLRVFDRLFLRRGELQRLLDLARDNETSKDEA